MLLSKGVDGVIMRRFRRRQLRGKAFDGDSVFLPEGFQGPGVGQQLDLLPPHVLSQLPDLVHASVSIGFNRH